MVFCTSESTFTQPAAVKTFCMAVSEPRIRKFTMSPGLPALSAMRRGIFSKRESSKPGREVAVFGTGELLAGVGSAAHILTGRVDEQSPVSVLDWMMGIAKR